MSKQRWYLGIKFRNELCRTPIREIFLSEDMPTEELFPQYDAAIGPFRTKRAALWAVDNPFHGTVADAEYWAKEQA